MGKWKGLVKEVGRQWGPQSPLCLRPSGLLPETRAEPLELASVNDKNVWPEKSERLACEDMFMR